MTYLLSGLLVFHGIVCLLGAFFPFYPPVYFFYVFFPGHFAIRLIIVLFLGAAQIVYGLHLILRKRYRIRWYWPAIATILITGLLLIFPAVQNPGLFGVSAEKDEIRQPILFKEMLPVQGEEAPDDIVPAPGLGPAYRANIHQQDVENPWPPVNTTKVTITSAFEADTVYIQYRDYIETKAGESRNNAISISVGNRAVGSLNLYTVNLPAGIEVTEGMRWHGPGPVSPVLVIEISPDFKEGEHTFGIGIEIDGKDYGTISCTIEVVEEPYPGNQGITTTKVEPKPGESGASVSGLMIKLTLDDLVEKSETIAIGKVVDIFPSREVDSEPRNIITDVVIEVERYLYSQSQSPYIVVMVRGGRVGETFMLVEDQPVFNLGEEAVLFLYRMESDISPPEGFDGAVYFRVTGSMQGKLGYKDGYTFNPEGEPVAVSEIEQKIASVHGGK
jgi:hypothetical protein